ncbi:MAG TPA: tRNA (guanosine(46)-N7)-methyltransferase TrmB [Cellvibrio sp.]|nr:tRNA (guanosine(46)-N7)-methyltransferase TrmB [Cellvibrio sp.]
MSELPELIPDLESGEEGFLIKPEFKPKSIRSFVIRAGRITAGQKSAFDSWWQSYGLSLFKGAIDPAQVFGRTAPLVLEIGFGMGDSLLEMARNEPEKNFIGIEVHPPGVGRLINQAGQEYLTNLRVYMADAMDVLEDCIPDGSIDRLQLYFPDPWHKKKHHKRRILQSAFVQKVRPKITPGGIFHMATDWQAYAEHMLEVMQDAPGFTNASAEADYAPRPDYRPITKFEKRGERLGHGVWDLMFKRSS